jgi:23S rRNA pseudouridine955/2504/2580 synthase
MAGISSTIINIDAEQQNQRIDNFLFKNLKGVPKSHIYRIIRTGQVRINMKRVRPDYKLQTNDQIRIPPLRLAPKIRAHPKPELVKLLQNRILYEDNNLLIINKPAGIATHGGSGINFGAIEILRELYPRLELVHRLDRDTSGCLLLAKKRSTLKELHILLRNNQIRKTYLALSKGFWKDGKQIVAVPLLKNILKSGERMVCVNSKGRVAITEFRPKQKFSNATFMEVILHTGRTHQIRVHAAYIGHPIAGDEKYGDKEFNKIMRQKGLKRLFLHAYRIKFRLPSYPTFINIKAELGEDLLKFLKTLLDPRIRT